MVNVAGCGDCRRSSLGIPSIVAAHDEGDLHFCCPQALLYHWADRKLKPQEIRKRPGGVVVILKATRGTTPVWIRNAGNRDLTPADLLAEVQAYLKMPT